MNFFCQCTLYWSTCQPIAISSLFRLPSNSISRTPRKFLLVWWRSMRKCPGRKMSWSHFLWWSVSLNHVKKKKTFSWFEFDMWNVFRSKVIFHCNRDLISYQYLLEFSRFLRVAPRWVLQAPSWNLSKNVGGLPPARQWWPSGGASHSKFPLIAATSPYV